MSEFLREVEAIYGEGITPPRDHVSIWPTTLADAWEFSLKNAVIYPLTIGEPFGDSE